MRLAKSKIIISFFKDGCFTSKGKFTGDKLENKITAPVQSAKECQTHCANTQGCSFFSFKEVQSTVYCGFNREKEDCSFCPQVIFFLASLGRIF